VVQKSNSARHIFCYIFFLYNGYRVVGQRELYLNMNYRQLGKSTLQISEIGFGCMSLQGSDESDIAILRQAVDLGINFFDTADLYQHGRNEMVVGEALKENRKKLFISTKVGNQWRSDGSGWDWNPRKEYILTAVEESLKRLQTDYIDLYQLHGGTLEDPIDETIGVFERLQQQGKIRYYGISSIRPNLIREYIERSSMVSVMMQYSLLDRRPEEICLPLLRDKEISVLARGVLAKGLLVNKSPASYLSYDAAAVDKIQHKIHSLARKRESIEDVSVRWVLREQPIASAVIGIRTMDQLSMAVAAGNADKLSKDAIDQLNALLPPNYYDMHR
jgi:aryl-alcohol dehydrogenase-like predicted oxidoreductase